MVRIKAVVLDLDGTLFNIDQRELHSINKALLSVGMPPLSIQSFIEEYYSRPYEQIGARNLITKTVGDKTIAQHAIEVYRDEFWRTPHLTRLHEGTLDVLQNLKDKDMCLAIATLRARRTLVKQEIQQHKIDEFVDVLVTREDIENPSKLPPSVRVIMKPRRQQFQKTLTLLKAEPSNTLIVGDSWWDIRAAKQVQAKTVWIKTGFGAYNDFSREQPDITIGNLKELPKQIPSPTNQQTQKTRLTK